MNEKIICPLSQAAAKQSDSPAILFGRRAISFKQLDQYVWSTVKTLKKFGINPGDRVAIVDQNSVEYLIVLLSLWRLDAVALLLNFRLPPEALAQTLTETESRLIFSNREDILSAKKIRHKKNSLADVINFDIRDLPFQETAEISLTQEATLLQTSGTSGAPKMALHTYGNHYSNALSANQNIPFKPGDRWLLTLPLFHVGGLGILLRSLLGQGTMVIMTFLKDESVVEIIRREKVTHLSLVSTQLYRLLNDVAMSPEDLKSLKVVLLGGSSFPRSLLERAIQFKLPINLSYGLTEMASQVATSIRPVIDWADSQVKVLSHAQLQISSANEIRVRGPSLFKGYWSQGRCHLPVTKDGWFETGDLGFIDAQNYLTITGRKDNMFISGGENIQPEEIETKLTELKGIAQAIVVPFSHSEFGFRPAAFITLDQGVQLSKKEIISNLKNSLPGFKIPTHFYHFPEEKKGVLKPSRRDFQKLIEAKDERLKPIA